MAIYRGSRYQETIVYNFISEVGSLPTLETARTVPTLRRRDSSGITGLDSVMYIFIQGDRLDRIAYKYYGDAQLWWVILDSNPQYLSPFDIRAGDTLLIPSYSEVRRSLGL